MKAQSTAKPEQSRHQDSLDRGGQGQGQQAMAVLDSRPEMAQQQDLLSLMAGSPRLQRKCACGAPSAAGGSCAACEGKQNRAKPVVLQKQLAIGAADDPLEREADRVADQVMAAPAHSAVSGAPLRIQRFQNQGGGQMDKAPASVERVLASSGRPLEPGLRRDMEQRFGHDFSRVRLHTDAEAGRSAQDVNASAYTAGHNIVFGMGRFAPGTHEGRRLIAHELTHVVQQNSEVHAQNIQRSCGPEEIRTTESCISTSSGVADRPRYLFRVNCDEFLEGNELDLRSDAASIESNEVVEIHGLASEEGSAEFNLNLSCARALKAKTVIEDTLAIRGVSATIITYSHGSQPGIRSANRSVALIRRTTPRPGTTQPIAVPEPHPQATDPHYDPVPGVNECTDSTYCTPYSTPAEISSAKAYLLTFFIPVLEGLFGADVGALWRSYLSRSPGDSLAPRIFDTPGNSIYEAFTINNYIEDEVNIVLDLVASRLSRGYGNVVQPLDRFIDPPERELSTDFANAFTIPGNIAGGVGSSDAGRDHRKITWGNVSFDITELPFGRRIVEIEAYVNFEVKDAIDFCPGFCGAIAEQKLATIKMSRLEASEAAYDVPFIVRFPGPRKTKTVIV